MLELNKSFSDYKKVLDELLLGSGVVLFKKVFDLNKINEAREIINNFESFDNTISKILQNGDFLMIKGSNATKLYRISENFLRSS